MMNQAYMWPEGETFTREVIIMTGCESLPREDMDTAGYENFPIRVTFKVPPFDVVVETLRNTDPDKAYSLFRQFIDSWDQEDELTDNVLMAYLYAYPGTDEALFNCWVDYMKDRLSASEQQFSILSQAIH